MNTSASAELSPIQIGNRLKEARNRLDLTLQDVAKNLNFSISTLSDIERGQRQVSSVELFRFARFYSRPIEYFLKEGKSGVSFHLLLRAIDATAISKDMIVKFEELCDNYSFIKELIKAPDMSSPPDYSRKSRTIDDAEEIADSERANLGASDQPIKDIYALLESKRGIKIFHLPENPKIFAGAFANDEACGSCFLINSNNTYRRRAFTVAHEYGHCIAHRDQIAHIDSDDAFENSNTNERFADAFAAAFLMPRRSISEMWNYLRSDERNTTPSLILQLAVYFGVSFEAVGWRLVTLHKLSKEKWLQICEQHIPSTPIARFFGYQIEDDKSPEMLPSQYKYLCYQAYEQHLISFERLAELLNRNFHDLWSELSNSTG